MSIGSEVASVSNYDCDTEKDETYQPKAGKQQVVLCIVLLTLVHLLALEHHDVHDHVLLDEPGLHTVP